MLRFILAFLLFISLPALADPASRPPFKPSARRQLPKAREPQAADQRFFVGALYSTANQLNYTGQVDLSGRPTAFSATEQTSTAFGLSGGYLARKPSGFGFGGELIFEFARKSQGITGTAGALNVSGSYQGDGGTNLLTAALSGNYSFGSALYVFAGLNYPLTFAMKGSETLSGLPGYQGGVGYAISSRFSTELAYRVVRMKGSINAAPLNLQIDEVSFPGFILSARYFF